jgi:hypothetical protein
MKGRPATISTTFDDNRAAEVEKILQKALAEAPYRKIDGLCDGYWNWGIGGRTRSALLPPG